MTRQKIASGNYAYRGHFVSRPFIGAGWQIEKGGRVIGYRDTLKKACEFVDGQ